MENEQKEQENYSKRFSKMSEIQRIDDNEIKYIKSNFSQIDRSIIGFAEGEVSVWSGLNGSGKSNFLTQQILEYAMQGVKTMLFSGEMQDFVIQNTMIKMVAGKDKLTPSSDGTYWFLQDEKRRKIILSWLDKYVYLYKNEYSMSAKEMLNSIVYSIKKYGVKMIIIDNLMTIDLHSYDKDKYEAQSMFVKDLAKLAKGFNVHIHIVCHPRKSAGFLRKDDISGTADLSNAVDNVFIIHRVNKDFVKRSADILDSTAIKQLSQFSNIIEICKNRRHGAQDVYIGLFFEPETKKFMGVDRANKEYMRWI